METPGGRIQIQWDFEAKATPNGQLAFFAEFLKTSGVYRIRVESCPLSYSSPNAPEKGDVLGTWLLSIRAGHNRYAHVTGLRGDGVSREILGIENIASEDALRRGLARMSGEQSQAWLQPQLLDSVGEALKRPWILDIDTTIKPLYGKQEGAEGQRWVTTRTSQAVRAMRSTPIGWAICGWCWMWWWRRATRAVRQLEDAKRVALRSALAALAAFSRKQTYRLSAGSRLDYPVEGIWEQ